MNKYIADILLLILLLSPTSGVFYYLMTLVVLFCIFYYRRQTRTYWGYSKGLKLLFIICCFFSVSLYAVSSMSFSVIPCYRALILILMMFFFPFVSGVKIHKITILIGVLFTLSTQLCYVVNFTPLIRFVNDFYPFESDLHLYSDDYLSSAQGMTIGSAFRLGGFMHNPNNCARTYTFFYAILLIFVDDWKLSSKNFLQYLCSLCIMLGLLLCGSRTGFVVFALLSIIKFYITSNTKRKILIFLLTMGFIAFVYSFLGGVGEEEYRALRVAEGMDDSMTSKFNHIVEYYSAHVSLFHFLFGQFDQHQMINYLKDAESMDSEIGVSLFTYGVVTTVVLFLLLYSFFKKIRKPYILFAVLLLWMLSSSLLFAYRVSLAFMFLLSICFSNSKIITNEERRYNNKESRTV